MVKCELKVPEIADDVSGPEMDDGVIIKSAGSNKLCLSEGDK
jgi:hypothetical protein